MKEIISSLQNVSIKKIIKMRRANKRRDEFLIEGEKELSLALIGKVCLNTVYFCFEFGFDKKILNNINQKIIFEVSKDVFQKISLRENPDGILAIAKNHDFLLDKIDSNKVSTIIVLESVEKPGNIGAIVRSIDAVGDAAIILLNPKTNFFNPNVIRTSRGSVFTIQKAICNQDEFFAWVKKNKIKVFATSLQAEKNYTDIKYPSKSIFLFGTEHSGLSDNILKLANKKIKIPMNGKIDSLNVSVSSAIILYEVLRQKS